jgi:hypothetical protein
VKLTLGYVNKKELKVLEPVLDNVLKKDVQFDVIQVREDELKFELKNLDLAFVPLPMALFIENIKFISNGAFVTNRLGLKTLRSNISKICVNGSNSTEYYLFRMLTNYRIPIEIMKNNKCEEGDAIIEYENFDISLDEIWRKQCGDLPIVISLIGSIKLSDNVLSKIKIIIRESASIQEGKGEILSYSKELGLKGRQSIMCFFQTCFKKGLCKNVIDPYIL